MKVFLNFRLVFSFCCLIFAYQTGQAENETPERHYVEIGAKECAACHSHPSPLYQQLGVTSFIRLVEAREWFERDKHAVAYQMVRFGDAADGVDPSNGTELSESNRLSQSICEQLGWKKGDNNFERQCLTCHVGLDANADMTKLRLESLRFGVQCEACHGPGSGYTEREHHQQVSWRSKTPEQKAALGMRDLRSPTVAANVCLSCHLGDIEQNRFVTHAMYAAGHPPLPPFDLQVFMEAMPPHWQPLSNEVDPDRKGEESIVKFELEKEFYDINFKIRTEEDKKRFFEGYHETQRSMIGAIVAQQKGYRLTFDLAETPDRWGDFAIYDCMGCHQELKANKARTREANRVPGRAYPARWWNIESSVPAVIASIKGNTTDTFFATFDQVPFGDRSMLLATKQEFRRGFNQNFGELLEQSKRPLTELQARAWLVELYRSRKNQLHDYWLAKQTAWMFQVGILELIQHRVLADQPSQQLLESLKQELQLDIFGSQQESVLKKQRIVLESAKNFDVEKCRGLFDQLVRLLEPPLNASAK
jgi:Cytochrome c554 and c-prime